MWVGFTSRERERERERERQGERDRERERGLCLQVTTPPSTFQVPADPSLEKATHDLRRD